MTPPSDDDATGVSEGDDAERSARTAGALGPAETALVGGSRVEGRSIVRDATWLRIEALVDFYLIELRRSEDGWSTLYRDPGDGGLWEHTYPQSHLHGGGPPALHRLSAAEARARYGDAV